MPKIVWTSDLHLDFVDAGGLAQFLTRISEARCDALLIGGDISTAATVADHLLLVERHLDAPVYFVLGNHDFYGGSIRRVRQQIEALCREHPRLAYLSTSGVHELSPDVGLIGHDGWPDARVGDYDNSSVMLNDYRLIEELSGMDKRRRRALLEALGDEAAEHIRRVLPEALEQYPRVVLLTHVPPLREACWHEGRMSDDEWSPHFTCLAVGRAVLEIMAQWPTRRLTVLCGHTHSSGECRPAENVLILTAAARYGRPDVQQVFDWQAGEESR